MKGDTMRIQGVLSRQVHEVLPSAKKLTSLMQKQKIRLYLGVDPTSPNLHLGHTIPLRKLRQFQELGHEVILLFGTFTARIGDPSGRDKARQPLSPQEVKENIRTYRKQAGLVLDMKRARIKKNHTWLDKMSALEVQRLASHVTVAHLWERDMFQERKKRGQAVWLNEMFYPLLQGYDSVAMDVDLEVGGTDQTFNMLVGRELQRAYHNKEKYILTTPLLVGLDGRKMSKSYGNTVNILDAPEDMYGKLMSMGDELVFHYFDLCTDISEKEYRGLSPRDAKIKLAREIVTQYHGKTAATKAEKHFDDVFRKKEAPKDMPAVRVHRRNLSLVELLVATQLATSKAQARRLVAQGGVSVDRERQHDADKVITIGSGVVVQVGKRRFVGVTTI